MQRDELKEQIASMVNGFLRNNDSKYDFANKIFTLLKEAGWKSPEEWEADVRFAIEHHYYPTK
jgi:hypothetical protein